MQRKLFFLLALILTACSTAVPATSTMMPSATLSLMPTITPTVTIKPTLSPTIIPTHTNTPPSSFQWAADAPPVACLQVRPAPPTELNLPWVLLGNVDRWGTTYLIVDPENGNTTQVPAVPPPDQMSYIGLSPDGKWLAYEDISYPPITKDSYPITVEPAKNLLTNSSNGRFKAWQAKASQGKITFIHWLNNTEIAVEAKEISNTIVFKPFTKQEYDFAYRELPNAASNLIDMSGTFAFSQANSLPDPTLTRLIYVADGETARYTALWDIQNKKAFGGGFGMFSDPFNVPPGWSIDGSDFIILGLSLSEKTYYSHEWFQMTRDGKVRQLTHFNEYLSDFAVIADSRSWDGRYLAIQIESDPNQNLKTLVMNLKSPNLDGFCVDESSQQSRDSLYRMSWSPDSKYLVISEDDRGNWTLIDIEKRIAYLIPTHAQFDVVGWIAADGPLPTSVPIATP